MRQLLETHTALLQKPDQLQKKDIEQDDKIVLNFEYLRQLEQSRLQQEDKAKRKRIGSRHDSNE